MTGAYATATAGQIHATLSLLRHVRAFLASDCLEMRDPFSDFDGRLSKPHARRLLTWLVHVAICRKAGWADDPHAREVAPVNHRGTFPRRRTGDAQRHLSQLADRLNRPRLAIRARELGEWRTYLESRCAHRLTSEEEY